VPVHGIGTWKACARRTTVPERVESDDRTFTMLVEAHDAADVLVRDVLGHACDKRCGHWRQLERRRQTAYGDDSDAPRR
jgi:hypothetical protein